MIEDNIFYTIARLSDALDLARVHKICGQHQKGSFMPLLGLRFLRAYYKVMLQSEGYVVLIARRKKTGECLGFHSGSLDAEVTLASLKNAKYYLGLVAFTSLIFKPILLCSVIKRYFALQNPSCEFIIKNGPRGEYWAWLPNAKPLHGAIEIHKLWHHLMRLLGCRFVKSEVNVEHERVRKTVIAMGGVVIAETVDLNNKARLLVSYDLEKYCQRFPFSYK